MTRLTEDDIYWLPDGVAGLDERLARVTGLGLAGIAARALDLEPDEAAELLGGAPVAALPISAGQGFISRFSESVASICRHVGCDAWVAPHPDIAGLADAAEAGARLVFAADEERFIALNITTGVCSDNGEATGRAFLAADPDRARLEQVSRELGLQPVELAGGLARCHLVLDAAPVGDLIPAEWVTPDSIVSAPGIPPAAGLETAAVLGERHIHEPLALGVVTMALEGLR
jgi:pyrrolysine biosynthesis protein PylD